MPDLEDMTKDHVQPAPNAKHHLQHQFESELAQGWTHEVDFSTVKTLEDVIAILSGGKMIVNPNISKLDRKFLKERVYNGPTV